VLSAEAAPASGVVVVPVSAGLGLAAREQAPAGAAAPAVLGLEQAAVPAQVEAPEREQVPEVAVVPESAWAAVAVAWALAAL
jgi:hypothetical protein